MREYQEASTALPMSLSPVTPPPDLKSRVLAAATGESAPRPAILTRFFWAAAAVVLFSIVIGTLVGPDYERYDMAGADPSPNAQGHVLWHDREVKLRATRLARLPADKVYELWHIPAGKNPIPAGTYREDAQGGLSGAFTLPYPVAKGDVFAVTIEPAPGTKQPTGQMPLKPK